MPESVFGDTAAPHPLDKLTWSVDVDAVGGTFDLDATDATGATTAHDDLAYDTDLATLDTEMGGALVDSTGGPLNTAPIELAYARQLGYIHLEGDGANLRQEWEVEVTDGGAEAGTFDLSITLSDGTVVTEADIAFDVAAATLQTAIRALDAELADADVTGGPGATAALVIEYNGSVGDLTVDGTDLTDNGSTVVATQTSAGTVTVTKVQDGAYATENITTLNAAHFSVPARPRHSRDYTGNADVAETYVEPDGTPISSGGGI